MKRTPDSKRPEPEEPQGPPKVPPPLEKTVAYSALHPGVSKTLQREKTLAPPIGSKPIVVPAPPQAVKPAGGAAGGAVEMTKRSKFPVKKKKKPRAAFTR